MHTSLQKGIHTSLALEGVEILSYAMTSDGAVTLLISFYGGDTFAPRAHSTLADMTASLLDTGTKKYAKDVLREKIESLGANVHFYARGNRVNGVVRCLYKDVRTLLPILVSELREADFKQREIAIIQAQMLAQCEEDKTETGTLALQRLSELLYPKNHPNYLPSIKERTQSISSISRSHLTEFYATYYGRSAMHVVAVGDLEHARMHEYVRASMAKLPIRNIVPPARPAVPRSAGTHEVISIRDKMTVDVILGHEVPFTRDHPDYYPFMIGIEVLGGGGFTSHLMQTVRERDGLTYHIRAGLSGFGEHDQGNWFIRTQFAPALYKRGLETTVEEVKRFQDSVLTDARIEAKKTEIVGSYFVSLGTTQGVASRILRLRDEGKPLSEIDNYPETITAITPEQVRRAIQQYLDLTRASIVSVGSIDKKGNPI